MSKPVDDMIAEYVAEGGDFRDWRPSWNIKPTQTVPVLVHAAKGEADAVRRLEPARWSLVPSWSKELKTKFPTFNARAEGIAEKATWRTPLKSHRSAVLIEGWYEWRTDPDTGTKSPFYVHNPGGEPVAVAGLYSWWKDPAKADDDPTLWTLTSTIITSAAVDQMLDLHDRNPVPLAGEWLDTWLDPEVPGDQYLVDAAVQAALPLAAQLEIIEVAPLPAKGDGPQLVTPLVRP